MAFCTDHLDGEQLKIAKIIISVLGPKANDNGNNSFVPPSEWSEKFGRGSSLVLVHDGGDLAPYVNYDYGQYALCQELDSALEVAGYYVEQCTCWYAAVYPVGV